MARKKRNTVYSTDPAFKKRCARCGSYPCRCPKPKSLPIDQQIAHLRREKKGRGGKTVIVIMNLKLTSTDMKALAKQLKRACGSGGSVKGSNIEIQGDKLKAVTAQLEKMGFSTKVVGG